VDLSPVDEVHVLSFPSEKVGSRPHMNLPVEGTRSRRIVAHGADRKAIEECGEVT
jgi:hypothetical protein